VISVYFNIDHGDRGGGWLVALRDGLAALEEPEDHEGKLALRETRERIAERFEPEAEPPPGRAQVGFVEVSRREGVEDWSSQQIPLRETVVQHASRPLLLPLIELLGRGEARPVVAISAERVRGWVWSRGRLEAHPEWGEELGIYPGHERKAPSMSDPARGQATSSSGRDQYGQRLDENRKRFLHEFGHRIGQDARVRASQLVAIGDTAHLDEFATALPATVGLHRIDGVDAIGESDSTVAERVEAEIERAIAAHGAELVRSAIDAAMASEGRGAVGVDETSEALAEGRVEHLLIDVEMALPASDLSPPAREAVAGDGHLDGAELMVELALRTSAQLTPLAGEVAEPLREHGGAAALLRY